MAIKKELSVVLPNKPGTLADVTSALSKAKVSLLAVDASGGFEYNIVRLVPDKTGKARTVLGRQGLDVGESNVVCVFARDEPGALAKIAGKLGRAKINIDYLYATAGKGGEALIVLHTADSKKAAKALR
ncbi:MAG TPA: ACT domain-containing protein [Verrucomicrobiae bacterium]|nr:ACT domain-containing protein [Verrucomicrobiae bacterium]